MGSYVTNHFKTYLQKKQTEYHQPICFI